MKGRLQSFRKSALVIGLPVAAGALVTAVLLLLLPVLLLLLLPAQHLLYRTVRRHGQIDLPIIVGFDPDAQRDDDRVDLPDDPGDGTSILLKQDTDGVLNWDVGEGSSFELLYPKQDRAVHETRTGGSCSAG